MVEFIVVNPVFECILNVLDPEPSIIALDNALPELL